MTNVPKDKFRITLNKDHDHKYRLMIVIENEDVIELPLSKNDMVVIADCVEAALAPTPKKWDLVGGKAGYPQPQRI